MKQTKTIKVRVKDRYAPLLRQMARSVNFVWNYLNELSQRSIRERGVFLSAFDLDRYTQGAGKLLGLHSQTVQEVSREYATRRIQFRKARLNWRKSSGVRRSLGWIPFKSGAASWKHGQVYHNGHFFKVWDSYGLADFKFRSGSFSEDARGRWYFNVVVEVEAQPSLGQDAIGIDLGLKDVATCSDGERLENGRFYRDLEPALAIAQRAGKKARVRAIHAKIANRRRDALHQFSRALVERCNLIVVGDVSPRENCDGQVGAGRRLGSIEDDAGLQVRARRHRVQRGQRGVHHPNLQLLRRIAQQQAERYPRAWNKRMDLQ